MDRMDTGGLSARQKGDIYWQKRKNYLLAAAMRGGLKEGFLRPDTAAEVLECYEKLRDKGVKYRLCGNEFRELPPTETGQAVFADMAAELMCERDRLEMEADPAEEKAVELLRELTGSYFKAAGLSETGEAVGAAERAEGRRAFEEALRRYGDRFSHQRMEAQEEAYVACSDELIGAKEIEAVKELIPESYYAQIRRGELKARILRRDGKPRTIAVTAQHSGWLELVWFSFPEELPSASEASELLKYCIRRERETRGKLKGAFLEVHAEEYSEALGQVLTAAGMECRRGLNNIYEFTISQVGKRRMLERMKGRLSCRSLSECQDREKTELDAIMQEDKNPSPVPLFMDWYAYDQELSRICFHDGRPVGCLLFREVGEYLIPELAYTTEKSALPVLIAAALEDAERRYGGDKKLLVSLVVDKTVEILNNLVPDARRGEIIQACMWF